MDVGTIIGGLIVAVLAFFGLNKVKNGKALDDYRDLLDKMDEIETDKGHIREALDIADEERHKAADELKKKLKREVSDEEVVDFINDRYRNS